MLTMNRTLKSVALLALLSLAPFAAYVGMRVGGGERSPAAPSRTFKLADDSTPLAIPRQIEAARAPDSAVEFEEPETTSTPDAAERAAFEEQAREPELPPLRTRDVTPREVAAWEEVAEQIDLEQLTAEEKHELARKLPGCLAILDGVELQRGEATWIARRVLDNDWERWSNQIVGFRDQWVALVRFIGPWRLNEEDYAHKRHVYTAKQWNDIWGKGGW